MLILWRNCPQEVATFSRPESIVIAEQCSDRRLLNRLQAYLSTTLSDFGSKAKIERWLTEKQAAREKDERKAQHQAEGGKQAAKSWLNLLTAALESGTTKQLGILLHRYKSGVANERIRLKDTITTRLVEVTPDFLMTMKEDVLYRFTSN
jgi:hypothetical protein